MTYSLSNLPAGATSTLVGNASTRVSMKTPTRSLSVRENAYGNWYGYVGNRRVEMFFGNSYDQQFDALAWLAAEAAKG